LNYEKLVFPHEGRSRSTPSTEGCGGIARGDIVLALVPEKGTCDDRSGWGGNLGVGRDERWTDSASSLISSLSNSRPSFPRVLTDLVHEVFD